MSTALVRFSRFTKDQLCSSIMRRVTTRFLLWTRYTSSQNSFGDSFILRPARETVMPLITRSSQTSLPCGISLVEEPQSGHRGSCRDSALTLLRPPPDRDRALRSRHGSSHPQTL